MSISVGLDRNFVRFLPFINGLSKDEYRNSLIENDSVTPEILEKELSIYDYIDKRYSNALKQAREDDVLFEFVRPMQIFLGFEYCFRWNWWGDYNTDI